MPAVLRSAWRFLITSVRVAGRKVRQNLVVELAGALTFTLLIVLWTWMQGVHRYTVYVVGDFRPVSRHAREVYEGIRDWQRKNRPGQPLMLGDIPVVFKTASDNGDKVLARRVAGELAASDDALMVVGHFASARSKAVANVYLNAHPPVPMMLPTETNPNVVPTPSSEDYQPVFRLSPSDDQQAQIAARYLVRRGCDRIIALDDRSVSPTDNKLYSRYLVDAFLKQAVLLAANGATGSCKIWPQDVRRLRLEVAGASVSDCVFLVGSWSTALLVIDRMQPEGLRHPAIVLSDSAVDPRLLGRLPTNGARADILITHTISSSELNPLRALGHDAFDVIEGLIDQTPEEFSRELRRHGLVRYWLYRLLNIHRVDTARRILASRMERAVARRENFARQPQDRSLMFRYDGSRDEAKFYLWRLQPDGSLQDVPTDGPVCASPPPKGEIQPMDTGSSSHESAALRREPSLGG